MTGSKRKRAAEIRDTIRQILYRDWDPIGVCGTAPGGEYDSYIGGVYQVLASSRSEEALVRLLARASEDILGSPPSAPERLRAVAHKLLALDVRLSGLPTRDG
jgi:hypothetical protein